MEIWETITMKLTKTKLEEIIQEVISGKDFESAIEGEINSKFNFSTNHGQPFDNLDKKAINKLNSIGQALKGVDPKVIDAARQKSLIQQNLKSRGALVADHDAEQAAKQHRAGKSQAQQPAQAQAQQPAQAQAQQPAQAQAKPQAQDDDYDADELEMIQKMKKKNPKMARLMQMDKKLGESSKLTKSKLQEIIQEELEKVVKEYGAPVFSPKKEKSQYARKMPVADEEDGRTPLEKAVSKDKNLKEDDLDEKKKWMQDIKSTGECTPYTKPGCTGKA